jgi:hypothetical protein
LFDPDSVTMCGNHNPVAGNRWQWAQVTRV